MSYIVIIGVNNWINIGCTGIISHSQYYSQLGRLFQNIDWFLNKKKKARSYILISSPEVQINIKSPSSQAIFYQFNTLFSYFCCCHWLEYTITCLIIHKYIFQSLLKSCKFLQEIRTFTAFNIDIKISVEKVSTIITINIV